MTIQWPQDFEHTAGWEAIESSNSSAGEDPVLGHASTKT
jgi:hypothetical protein